MIKFTGTIRDIEDNVMEEKIDIWIAETGTDFKKEYRGYFESTNFFIQSTPKTFLNHMFTVLKFP